MARSHMRMEVILTLAQRAKLEKEQIRTQKPPKRDANGRYPRRFIKRTLSEIVGDLIDEHLPD